MKVSFIGLGAMGRIMAENALRSEFDLMVYDLRPEPLREMEALGARVAGSAREAGEHGEVIQLAVPDDAQVEAALLGPDGALAGASAGSVIAIHSTVRPDTVRRVAERARTKSVDVIDAQMSGAQHGAHTQTLLFMVGGEVAAMERARPVLEANGRDIFHMGDLGMGAVTKIAQQIVTCVNLLAATEGLHLARRAGVDLEAFYRVLALSTAQSYVIDHRMGFPAVYGGARGGSAGGERRPFHRGLRAALALAYDLDVPVPAAALAQQTIPWALGDRDP